ncbi:uncharacterized protein METZ01_LOCUS471532, partial [marine metagenome]
MYAFIAILFLFHFFPLRCVITLTKLVVRADDAPSPELGSTSVLSYMSTPRENFNS